MGDDTGKPQGEDQKALRAYALLSGFIINEHVRMVAFFMTRFTTPDNALGVMQELRDETIGHLLNMETTGLPMDEEADAIGGARDALEGFFESWLTKLRKQKGEAG